MSLDLNSSETHGIVGLIDHLKFRMFCCSNDRRFNFYRNEAEKREILRRARTIDEEIENEKLSFKKTLKILLLGMLYGQNLGWGERSGPVQRSSRASNYGPKKTRSGRPDENWCRKI
ncbi:unnamed protein product [Meloidogyne enterolobii]|uniref:Uncharacterized protein n=1 Tax=Meloidogyne enterolobii TaxID=390850 RepID=A0ACB0Y5S1_MELEN